MKDIAMSYIHEIQHTHGLSLKLMHYWVIYVLISKYPDVTYHQECSNSKMLLYPREIYQSSPQQQSNKLHIKFESLN